MTPGLLAHPRTPIAPSVRRASDATTPVTTTSASAPVGPAPAGTAPRPNVELHIEELALHGFPSGARHAIGDAVQRELARLIAERGLAPALAVTGDHAYLDGGAFHMVRDTAPDRIGVQVARAIYGGLCR